MNRIRMAADAAGLDLAGVSSAIDAAGLANVFAGNIIPILRGNVGDISAADLRTLLTLLERKDAQSE